MSQTLLPLQPVVGDQLMVGDAGVMENVYLVMEKQSEA